MSTTTIHGEQTVVLERARSTRSVEPARSRRLWQRVLGATIVVLGLVLLIVGYLASVPTSAALR